MPKLYHLRTLFAVLLLFLVTINRFSPVVYGESACAYLFITPVMYIARETGEIFNIAVEISNVENLHSCALTITYNTSLLDVIQVLRGNFFPQQAAFEFEENESSGFVTVNISLPISFAPLNGNGTLAWIGFKVIQGPRSCVNSPLDLQQTMLLNSASIPISHDSAGAVYFWKSMQPDPPVEGALLDLYTPKAGVGPNEPGGEFMTGEMVHLFSRVEYNNDPVWQKLVAFEIRNPFNETVMIETAITDNDGLATVSFRIPSIPSSSGTWTCISIASICEEIIWDTLSFRVSMGPPVGGYAFPIKGYTTAKPLMPHLALIVILTISFIVVRRKASRKQNARERKEA